MSATQHRRLAALEKATPATMEPITIIRTIVRPDLSIAGYLLHTSEGYKELAPGDPLIAGYEPVTPEINGGYRVADWVAMGNKPHG